MLLQQRHCVRAGISASLTFPSWLQDGGSGSKYIVMQGGMRGAASLNPKDILFHLIDQNGVTKPPLAAREVGRENECFNFSSFYRTGEPGRRESGTSSVYFPCN